MKCLRKFARLLHFLEFFVLLVVQGNEIWDSYISHWSLKTLPKIKWLPYRWMFARNLSCFWYPYAQRHIICKLFTSKHKGRHFVLVEVDKWETRQHCVYPCDVYSCLEPMSTATCVLCMSYFTIMMWSRVPGMWPGKHLQQPLNNVSSFCVLPW